MSLTDFDVTSISRYIIASRYGHFQCTLLQKPALELFLQQIEQVITSVCFGPKIALYLPQDPETNGLKRLLAVKKSLLEFEQRIDRVMKVTWSFIVLFNNNDNNVQLQFQLKYHSSALKCLYQQPKVVYWLFVLKSLQCKKNPRILKSLFYWKI